jgi:hypothetical protein
MEKYTPFQSHAAPLAVVIVMVVCVFIPLSAQNIVQEDGTTIEFIGLKKWTMKQVQDSVRKHSPDGKLGFCAATLKSDLKFCEASVMSFAKDSTIITVIEPQDSIFVKRNAYFASNDAYLPREWDEFQEAFAYKVFEKRLALETLTSTDDSAMSKMRVYIKEAPSFVKFDTITFQNIRTALRTNPVQVERLEKVIRYYWDAHSRGVAVLAMTRLPDNDTCLKSVLYAMNDVGASTTIVHAVEYLSHILKHRTRPIPLTSLYAELRPLANGANLFGYYDVLKLIGMNRPTEKDFRAIFATAHSRRLLAAHLQATSSFAKEQAMTLIKAINPKYFSLSQSQQEQYLSVR